MRAAAPHHPEVFSHLPVPLMRELDTQQVAAVLEELIAAGWRPGQLRHRVGAATSQGSVERDAAHLLELLRGLREQPCPDALHAQQLAERAAHRRWEDEAARPPAAPEVRKARLAEIRASLRGAPRRRPEPEPRTRPDCSLCSGEGTYFVTREVHLCARCVEVLASGSARLHETG